MLRQFKDIDRLGQLPGLLLQGGGGGAALARDFDGGNGKLVGLHWS